MKANESLFIAVDILEQFILFELEEGKKLNAALGLSAAMMLPAAMRSSEERQTKELNQLQYPSKKKDVGGKKGSAAAIDAQKDAQDSDLDTTSSTTTYTRDELNQFVRDASEAVGIDASFVDAIIKVESNYRPSIMYGSQLSSAGAMGIMQFMPKTAKAMGLTKPFDPAKAIPAGARHLKDLLDHYDGDFELAAAAYNAGQPNVDKYGGIPPFAETQAYVPAVMKAMDASTINDE